MFIYSVPCMYSISVLQQCNTAATVAVTCSNVYNLSELYSAALTWPHMVQYWHTKHSRQEWLLFQTSLILQTLCPPNVSHNSSHNGRHNGDNEALWSCLPFHFLFCIIHTCIMGLCVPCWNYIYQPDREGKKLTMINLLGYIYSCMYRMLMYSAWVTDITPF